MNGRTRRNLSARHDLGECRLTTRSSDLSAGTKLAAAEAEAAKNNWPMAIVILDSTGHTVMLHKLDNTQYGSIGVAEDKAHSALDFRRPSKVFEDLVAQDGLNMRILSLRGAAPLEGGVPILVDGKTIGAIGVSGGASSHKKKGHFLAAIRRGYPPFLVQRGSAAGRWETQDGQVAKAGADAAPQVGIRGGYRSCDMSCAV